MGSLEETKVWLLFAKDCGYIKNDVYESYCHRYDEIGANFTNFLKTGRLLIKEKIIIRFLTSGFGHHFTFLNIIT